MIDLRRRANTPEICSRVVGYSCMEQALASHFSGLSTLAETIGGVLGFRHDGDLVGSTRALA